jgi:ketosteroid isomerase-like protein
LVEKLVAALAKGELSDDMFTGDATFWTLSGGAASKERFFGGVKLLQSLFPNGYAYTIDMLVADENHAAAEAQGRGVLSTGEEFHNVYVFTFAFRDGRIAALKEYQNPEPVRSKLMPLIQAAIARAQP